MVSHTDQLSGATANWLSSDAPGTGYVLGGKFALSDKVLSQVDDRVGTATRIAGGERKETATKIARQLHGQPASGQREYVVMHGWHTQGWAFGLATAGLGEPILLVHGEDPNHVDGETAKALSGSCEIDVLIAGSTSIINEDVRKRIDSLDPCSDGGGGGGSLTALCDATSYSDHKSTLDLLFDYYGSWSQTSDSSRGDDHCQWYEQNDPDGDTDRLDASRHNDQSVCDFFGGESVSGHSGWTYQSGSDSATLAAKQGGYCFLFEYERITPLQPDNKERMVTFAEQTLHRVGVL